MATVEELEAPFVIVGGGIAGVSCIEGLSFLRPDARMILLTASPLVKAVTNVVNLTKTLSQFGVEERNVATLADSYPLLSVVNDSLKTLDAANHLLVTEGGRTIRYSKVCLCTGGRAKLIAEGDPHVIGLRDTESAKEFQRRIKEARRIVVVGNGGIATEIAYETEGVEVVWVVKDKHISAAFVDPGAAEFFQARLLKGEKGEGSSGSPTKRMKYRITSSQGGWSERSVGAALGPDWHEGLDIRGRNLGESGVTIEYECEVKRTCSGGEGKSSGENAWPIYAELTNGKVVGCDFIVSATGVVPNGGGIAGDGLEVAEDRGLKVDWKMETTEADVFAAGDVCTPQWERARHWFQMRLWTQARQMGLYAAKCMDASYRGEAVVQDFCFELFSHVTRFFGHKVVLLGLFNGQTLGDGYDILLRVTEGVEYIKLVMREGRMQGAVLVGETDLEEMCENLILNQLDVGALGEDLLNPDIDIEDYFD